MQAAPLTIDVPTRIASRWQRRDEGDLGLRDDDRSLPFARGSRKTVKLGEFSDSGTKPTHHEIAVCAYSIWEQEERRTGRALDHWLQAELQLVVASLLPEKATESA